MKKIFQISLIVFIVSLTVSCNKDYPDITSEDDFFGLFVRSEEGTISYYNERNDSLTLDIYKSANGTELGNKAIAFASFGTKGYILKGEGFRQEIELVDLERFQSRNTIEGFAYLTDLKAISDQFVCATQSTPDESNSGSVVVMDSITLDKKITLSVGKNPTKLAYGRGKYVYIANSGTESYPDSTVMVLDITTKEIIDTISIEGMVGETSELKKLKSPVEIVIDANQDIWVLCKGFDSQSAGIAKISYVTHQVNVFPFNTEYVGPGKGGLITSLLGSAVHFVNDGVYTMEIDAEELSSTKLLKEGDYENMLFNAISINPYTGSIFCAKDGEAGTKGTVLEFDRFGYFSDNEFEVGQKPRQFWFIR